MISKKENLNLKVGNLLIAIILAIIPTLITYGILGIHGMNICNRLTNKLPQSSEALITKKACQKSSWETTSSYIILIGFFITLPTWFWFYICMRRKKTKY
tara:strand:- start:1170 stop:1469 length:300 start_codon:yes stop_codon:yes gene_type:complete